MFVTVLLASTLGKIFQPFFDAMAWVIAAFYAVVPNYALAIALLTLAVMVVTAPLTVKSSRSMMAMSKLQPQMKELQKKYKNDKVRLNEEMMKLYRENSVSPAAGCVPMLIQFPVFIILYDVIRGLTNTVKTKSGLIVSEPRYIGHNTALYKNLVHHPGVMKAFGLNLADDVFSHGLSMGGRVPYIIMILIAVGLQYFQMHQMNKRNAANGVVNQQMQTMTKVMPLVFMVIYVRIAAGVNVYFIVSNLCRIGLQMYSFRTMPAAEERRVGRLGAPAGGQKRKTIMERLAEAQQRALQQQEQQRRGATGPAPRPTSGTGRAGDDKGRSGGASRPPSPAGSGTGGRSRPAGGAAKRPGGSKGPGTGAGRSSGAAGAARGTPRRPDAGGRAGAGPADGGSRRNGANGSGANAGSGTNGRGADRSARNGSPNEREAPDRKGTPGATGGGGTAAGR